MGSSLAGQDPFAHWGKGWKRGLWRRELSGGRRPMAMEGKAVQRQGVTGGGGGQAHLHSVRDVRQDELQ